MKAPLILASKSAIRAQLLRQAGFSVELQPADVDERMLEAPFQAKGYGPDGVARGLAMEKALAVSRLKPEALVIGADQTMALGERRFSKVTDRASAKRHLQDLSGRTHALHSGFALARGGTVVAAGVSTAELTMRSLSEGELEAYLDLAGDAVLSSVGCYQLENVGVRLFEAITGDYFTILGLPLLPLLAALRAEGVS